MLQSFCLTKLNVMKTKNILYIVCLTGLITFAGCEANFDDINTNKISPTSLEAPLLMNQAVLDANYRDGEATLGMLTYHFGIVQQIITPYGSSLAGAN